MKNRKTTLKELDKMIEEATVDAYGDEEIFMSILYTLDENLSFPFRANVLGETVEVIGVDDEKSSLGRGVIAEIRKQKREYTIGLADLELEPDDTQNSKWLEMYHYWLSKY